MVISTDVINNRKQTKMVLCNMDWLKNHDVPIAIHSICIMFGFKLMPLCHAEFYSDTTYVLVCNKKKG